MQSVCSELDAGKRKRLPARSSLTVSLWTPRVHRLLMSEFKAQDGLVSDLGEVQSEYVDEDERRTVEVQTVVDATAALWRRRGNSGKDERTVRRWLRDGP
jgi:hypothetical protein